MSLSTKQAQSIYDDLILYSDRSVEEIKEGLNKTKEVLEIHPLNDTAKVYIEAVTLYLKETLH